MGAIELLRAHLAKVRMEGGDEQSAIETDRLIAAAMIEDPMRIMAMIREGEVMMTNSAAAASGLQRPKSEVRDPSEATMRERKRRQAGGGDGSANPTRGGSGGSKTQPHEAASE